MPDPDYERIESVAERLRNTVLQAHIQAYHLMRLVGELRDQAGLERGKAPDHDGRGPVVHS